MENRPYYLVATAGHPNFGDEFITASWIRYLAEVAAETEIWLDCPEPGNAQLLFGDLHPRLRITNTLWRAVWEARDLPPAEAEQQVIHLIRNQGSPRYDLGLAKLRDAQSLHLLGGGYVNGVWPRHRALVAGMKAVKGITGARLYATGQGLMPLIGSASEAEELFDAFDHVSVRDVQSAAAYGLEQGLDDAFLGAEDAVSLSSGSPAGLYVCIQNDMNDDGRFESNVAVARSLITRSAAVETPVYYLEAIPGVDHAAYARLSDLIPADNFIPFTEVWNKGLPVGSAQQWITTRFHFHLLASAAGARGVALSVKKGYYDVKHSSLTALGSGWTVDDGSAGTSPQMPAVTGQLARRLPELADRKREEAARLYPPVHRSAPPLAKPWRLRWASGLTSR